MRLPRSRRDLTKIFRDLAEITEISAKLTRTRRGSRDLGEITKISPRSRQDFSEISVAKNSPGISPRSRRDLTEILAEIGQISVKILYGAMGQFFPLFLSMVTVI